MGYTFLQTCKTNAFNEYFISFHENKINMTNITKLLSVSDIICRSQGQKYLCKSVLKS